MSITTKEKDQWLSDNYGLPSALYYYILSDKLEDNDNNTSVLGNCPGIQSIQYVPFIEPDDLTLYKIPYDVERFGTFDGLRPGLTSLPNVYRIMFIDNKVKDIGSFTIYKPNKNIGGKYDYRNESRLYNYPYSFAMLTDHLNKPIEIKYHLITTDKNQANIKVRSTISDRCSYGIYIQNYKGDVNGDLESMVSSDSHELPCSSSAYNQWFATNKNQTTQNINAITQNSFLTKQTNKQMFLPSTIGTLSSTSLNPMSIIGASANIYSSAINYNATNQRANLDIQQAIEGKMAQTSDLLSTPNTILSMGSDFYYGYDKGGGKLTLYRFGLHEKQLKKIGDYFHMFGYKQNKVITPNIRNRYYFNYIKTTGINLYSWRIPRNQLEELKAIFDRGTTIWHVDREGVIVGDYSNDNYEV